MLARSGYAVCISATSRRRREFSKAKARACQLERERDMQSLKSASLIRRSLRISPFKSSYRSLTSLSTNALSNDSDDIVSSFFSPQYQASISLSLNPKTLFLKLFQVLVEGKACSRTAILNRPPVLNALNTAVVCCFPYMCVSV